MLKVARQIWSQIVATTQTMLVPSLAETAHLFLYALPLFATCAVLWSYMSLSPRERKVKEALKRAFPRTDFKSVSTKTDFWCTVFTYVLYPPLLGLIFKMLAVVVSSTLFAKVLGASFGVPSAHLRSTSLEIAIQASVMIIGGELRAYLYHLASHKVDFLWAFHRPHHSAESLTALTAKRGHVLDDVLHGISATLFESFVLGICLYVTGSKFHPEALAVFGFTFGVLDVVHGLLQHSCIRLSFGPLNYVFGAPILHQLHHSAELRHRDKNFGFKLAICDWIFGTLYILGKDEQWCLGLNDKERGRANPHKRVRDLYFEPFRYISARYFNGE